MNKLVRSLFLQFPNAYRLVHHFKNAYFLNFYLKKVHEEDFKAFSLMFEEKPQLFLDIGANVGMSALSIFVLKPNAQVISFEPNPVNYSYLDRIFTKFSNFRYLPIGLSDSQEMIDFYYPIYNNKPQTGLGSLNYEHAAQWLNPETVYFFDKKKLQMKKITVEVKTLDSLNLNPDFIKIDVEGFEYYVLRGGEKTLNRSRPILLIEGVAFEDRTHRFLRNNGYLAYRFENNQFFPDEFECINNFFIPQEKIHLIESYLISEPSQVLTDIYSTISK